MLWLQCYCAFISEDNGWDTIVIPVLKYIHAVHYVVLVGMILNPNCTQFTVSPNNHNTNWDVKTYGSVINSWHSPYFGNHLAANHVYLTVIHWNFWVRVLLIITFNKGTKFTLRTENFWMAQGMNVSFPNETAGDSAIS